MNKREVVRLAIDGQGVAVADRAWGVIKALYR